MKNDAPKEQIVKSSLIQSYQYDHKDLKLSVTFRDGTQFDYFNVPPPVVSSVFDHSGSVGGNFIKRIGKSFKFVKTG